MTTTTANISPVMSAQEVAEMVGVNRRSIERAAQDAKSPYFAAKVVDGIDKLRFRRAMIEEIVHGRQAEVLPMKQRGQK